MSRDPIERLLHEADAGESPAPGAGLADRAERIVRRRRATKIAGSAATILLAACAALGVWMSRLGGSSGPQLVQGPTTNQPTSEQDIHRLKTELAAIQREADWREAMAARLGERQRRAELALTLQRKLSRPDPLEEVRQYVEYAACSMVSEADRMARNPDLREPAERVYRQVGREFPDTHWAAVARDRLEQMKFRKEG